MKAAVRCNALNLKKLIQQELHGKRLDKSSQRCRVRQAKPLVLDAKNSGLHLRDRLAAHIGGAKQNAAALKEGANVALHFIILYPPEVLDDDGPTPFAILDREQRKARMMLQAIKFINETHGGNAVFAARPPPWREIAASSMKICRSIQVSVTCPQKQLSKKTCPSRSTGRFGCH